MSYTATKQSKMGKSLSDQIAEIANKPVVEDFDIEDSERNVFEHKEGNDHSSEESEDDEATKSHYVKVGKSKLRDEGIALRDQKYQGSKGSRESIFEDAEEAEEASSGEVEGEESEVSNAENSESDSESAMSFRTDSEDQDASASEDSENEELEAEEEEEEEEDTEAKRKRMIELVRREAKSAVQRLSEATQKDAAKGFAILEQSRAFDLMIDTRIKIQKAVSATNQLPLSTESWDASLKESSKNEKLLQKTRKLLTKIMGQLVDFRREFQFGDNIIQGGEPDHDSKKKRTFAELCDETDYLDETLRDYRSVVLNKWSKKISSSSGKAVLSSSNFKAINQPADVQVENQLADVPRLLKRTTLNRRNVVPLHFEDDLEKGNLEQLGDSHNDEGNGSDEENPDVPKNYDPRRKDNRNIDISENPYIFDDEDFYRVLLNDLVDKKISGSQNEASGVTIALTSRSNNKLKKNVDTKASKGRKLKYTIQEPIANYEAPANGGFKWSDEQIDEFFAGLLGQRISFDEAEAIEDEQDDAEIEAIKNDDIQIFG